MEEVRKWYDNHKQHYDYVESSLSDVKEKFLSSDNKTQRQMLFNSLEFAVISIQTTVERHEEAYRQLKIEDKPIDKALNSVVYHNNKRKWLIRSRMKLDKANKVINHLENGKINKAHRLLIDEFTGVSTVKSAFTLCMLGFTSKACIDTNLKRFIGSDIEVYDGVVVDKYDKFCEQALDVGKELNQLSLFMRQWLIFDYMRNVTEKHKVYFEVQNNA